MASVSSKATSPAAAATDAGFGRRICVQVERTVDAPIQRVWVVLRDYRAARPRMLTEPFADYAVQQQDGERTVIDYRLRVGRHQRRYTSAVEEPMAGRQLRERALHSALVITWTLTPGGDGERTVARLAAELRDPDIKRPPGAQAHAAGAAPALPAAARAPQRLPRRRRNMIPRPAPSAVARIQPAPRSGRARKRDVLAGRRPHPGRAQIYSGRAGTTASLLVVAGRTGAGEPRSRPA
jgi:hypothetical protein